MQLVPESLYFIAVQQNESNAKRLAVYTQDRNLAGKGTSTQTPEGNPHFNKNIFDTL